MRIFEEEESGGREVKEAENSMEKDLVGWAWKRLGGTGKSSLQHLSE